MKNKKNIKNYNKKKEKRVNNFINFFMNIGGIFEGWKNDGNFCDLNMKSGHLWRENLILGFEFFHGFPK